MEIIEHKKSKVKGPLLWESRDISELMVVIYREYIHITATYGFFYNWLDYLTCLKFESFMLILYQMGSPKIIYVCICIAYSD